MLIGIDARMYGAKHATGIGQYIQRLTDNLFAIDQVNRYVLFLTEPVFDEFQPPSERVAKIKTSAHWYTYAEQFKLPFEFAKAKIDLIHYPHFNSPILYAKKSVCTIHDLTPFRFPGHKMKSRFRRWAYQQVFKSTTAKARQIIAVSANTKQDIINTFHLPADKIKVVYQGVDERFKIIGNNGIINQVKTRCGITQPFIFFIGVWRNHKNIQGLIQAFDLLKDKYKIPHELVLAGPEDPRYPAVRRQIEQSKYQRQIITPGFIADQDLPALYNAAQAMVIPSFIEGFGLIGIEAQRCGAPVVSSNTSCLPEILKDSAVYFNPRDIGQIAERIYQVIADPAVREELKLKGLKNSRRFSWRTCAEQTLAVYQQAVRD